MRRVDSDWWSWGAKRVGVMFGVLLTVVFAVIVSRAALDSNSGGASPASPAFPAVPMVEGDSLAISLPTQLKAGSAVFVYSARPFFLGSSQAQLSDEHFRTVKFSVDHFQSIGPLENLDDAALPAWGAQFGSRSASAYLVGDDAYFLEVYGSAGIEAGVFQFLVRWEDISRRDSLELLGIARFDYHDDFRIVWSRYDPLYVVLECDASGKVQIGVWLEELMDDDGSDLKSGDFPIRLDAEIDLNHAAIVGPPILVMFNRMIRSVESYFYAK